MPRGAKKSANQHNTRHENGIVAPGKRVSRQRSNGNLAGSPDGRPESNAANSNGSSSTSTATTANTTASTTSSSTPSSTTTATSPPALPPLPSNSPAQLTSQPPPVYLSNGTNGVRPAQSTSTRGERSKSLGETTSHEVDGKDRFSSPPSSLANGAGTRSLDESGHRTIDVSGAKSTSLSQEPSTAVGMAFTVLKSNPLWDTLAILIALLALPPTVLNLVNCFFAILTFVPPSGSFANLPSLTDFTSSFSPGSPSFTVMISIDLMVMAAWIFFPTKLQALVLDTAQAMVATTLGGGYSYRPGDSDRTIFCVSLVALTHVFRHPLISGILHRTWIGRWTPIPEGDSATSVTQMSGTSGLSWFGIMNVIITLHIVCAGATRSVRRFLYSLKGSSTSTTSNTSSAIRSADPEAGAGHPQATSEGVDISHPSLNSPTDLRHRGSLTNIRDRGDKVSSGKRRRKQGNYVRSQQPLWAAFAATKATILREYEQSQATTDAKGSHATDVSNLGSAPFAQDEGRIWITLVKEGSFFFETSLIDSAGGHEQPKHADGEDRNGNDIDHSKALYLRINGLVWASAKIVPVPNSADSAGRQRWTGEVYGLVPASTWQVTFLRSIDDSIMYSETLATPSPFKAEEATTISTSNHQHIRPSSPTNPLISLKASITAIETTVSERNAQQKRVRKDGRAAAASLRKDIESLNEKINRASTNESNSQNRRLQHQQFIRQAQDIATSISEEIEVFDKTPDDSLKEHAAQKSEWEGCRSEQEKAREELRKAKEADSRELTSLTSESIKAQQKRENDQARVKKLSDRHAKLTAAANGTVDSIARKNSDYSARVNERLNLESHYQQQVDLLSKSNAMLNSRFSALGSQCQALENAMQQAVLNSSAAATYPYSQLVDSRPQTPDNDVLGNMPMPASVGSGMSAYSRFNHYSTPESQSQYLLNNGYPQQQQQQQQHHQQVNMMNGGGHQTLRSGVENRKRSTSMYSGNSIYGDFDEDAPFIQGMLPSTTKLTKRLSGFGNVREDSEGSGSSHRGSPALKQASPRS